MTYGLPFTVHIILCRSFQLLVCGQYGANRSTINDTRVTTMKYSPNDRLLCYIICNACNSIQMPGERASELCVASVSINSHFFITTYAGLIFMGLRVTSPSTKLIYVCVCITKFIYYPVHGIRLSTSIRRVGGDWPWPHIYTYYLTCTHATSQRVFVWNIFMRFVHELIKYANLFSVLVAFGQRNWIEWKIVEETWFWCDDNTLTKYAWTFST